MIAPEYPGVFLPAVTEKGLRQTGVGPCHTSNPHSDDGKTVPFASVTWRTGFHSGFDWIDLRILDGHGTPRHRFGKSTDVDGLYFAGLHFQYAVFSTMVAGVGRAARRIVGWIAAARNSTPA